MLYWLNLIPYTHWLFDLHIEDKRERAQKRNRVKAKRRNGKSSKSQKDVKARSRGSIYQNNCLFGFKASMGDKITFLQKVIDGKIE